ncbi:PfkB family carbohydrate kinase [Treponema sp.]
MQQAFIIGPVFLDIITAPLSKFPSPGEEQYIESLDLSPGGFSITAMSLARLGVPCSLISALGNDQLGLMLKEQIQAGGVNTSFLKAFDGVQTNVSLAFPQAGDRSFLTRSMGEANVLKGILDALNEVPRKLVSHIHVNIALLRNKDLLDFVKNCRALGATVSLDLGWEEAQLWSTDDWKLVQLAEIFKPNETEALRITGAADILAALDILADYCPQPVITQAAKGSFSIDEKRKSIFMPSYKVTLKNAVGAGDAFTAGYLYGFLGGMGISDCLKYGNAAGALTAGSEFSSAKDMDIDRLKVMVSQGETV